MTKERNIFNEKGEAAEQLIATLCKDAFFEDFCFKNPYYAKGKELCDVLVILGDIAIIWQIKNIKLKNGQFNKSHIEKAIKQCRGAKRRLLGHQELHLENIVGEKKTIDTSTIKEIFLIAAIEGGTPDFDSYYSDEVNGNGSVHIFFEGFTRFATKHLNTVSDFVDYLRHKEEFLSNRTRMILSGGEEDLLALYLKNNRTFGNMEEKEGADVIFAELEGLADELEKDPEYIEKLEADEWSKGWDMLIQKKREGLSIDGSPRDPASDKFLAKMMSHNRFHRRTLSRVFFDAGMEALKGPDEENWVYKRIVPEDGVTYVFCFMGTEETDRGKRQAILNNIVLAARQVMPNNNMVIGVITEREMIKSPTAGFDWVMLDITDGDFEEAYGDVVREFREKTGTWSKATMGQSTAWEYPSDMRKKQAQKNEGDTGA